LFVVATPEGFNRPSGELPLFVQEMEMANKLKCPLCGGNVARHREDGCILAALIEVIRERDAISEQCLRRIHAHADVDALWVDLGQIIDKLEDGKYSA
jgi:hypothetical protein